MTKKKSKRLLCLFLSLSLVFAFNVTPAFATDTDTTGEVTVESTTGTDTEDETSSAADVWDGSVATGFDEGSGTEADPYLIATGAQLAYLSVQVRGGTDYDGCYFQLSADIDLNDIEFMPIGGKNSSDTTLPFKGNFDGDGHTISNLKITVVQDDGTLYFSAFNKEYNTHGDTKLGLFGYTYGDLENFTINNVSVDGTLLNGDLSNGGSGGAAAAVLGNTKSSAQEMENIHVTGDVSIVGNKFVGGIMGYNGTGVTYTNCSVSGNVTITGNCYVGGIVGGGICNSAYNTTFTDCSVGSADSTVQISGYYCVGGISGAVESSGDSNSYTYLTNCSVIGDSDSYITCLKHDDSTADSENSISNYFVGGLSGKFGWGSGNYGISDCTVEIDVNGSGAYHSGHGETSEINTDNLDVGAAFVGYTTCTGTITDTSYTGNAKVAYAFKQYSNDVITMTNVTINSVVASIGDTKYTSLADAFSAAEDGDTITLLQDVSVEESSKSDNGLYQVSGIGVTLDLNENTLTITNKRAFGVLTEGSSLTIKNGTVAYNASGDTTLVITRAGASFSAEDVTFEAIDADDGTTTTSQYLVYAAAGGDVTLTDCTISNVSNAVVKDNAGTATVVLDCCTYDVSTAVSGSNGDDDAYTIKFNTSDVLTQDTSGLVKVEDGYTYVVLEDGSVTANSTIYVKEGGKLVLDGGTLSGSVVIRGGTLEMQSGTVSDDMTVESGGTLTVSGGTVSGALVNSGTTSISGGTVSGAVTNASDAALALSDEGVINNTIKTAGIFTMTGGTITATGLNSDNGAIHVTAGTINISGGTVTAEGAKARAISTASSASIADSTISGGTFTGSNLALLVQTGTTGLTVTGGTFITSSTGLASIIDRASAIGSGYAAYDTTYTVVTASNYYYKSSVGDYTVIVADEDTTAAATVTAGDTTTYYTSLADAVSAANVAENAATITLLQSVDIDKPLSITSTVTLDLAGYTISESESFTSNYSSYYIIWVSGSLTVKDSANNDGCISTSAKYGVTVSGGTLTLDSGKITNTNSDTSGTRAIHLQSSAIVSINGGEVVGSGTNAIYVSSSTLTITGGSVSGSSSAYGIYQYGGTTTITGGTVSGYRAIYGTSGTVNVNGGTVTGTQIGIMANGSMDVNIIDGTVTGTNAIYMYQGNYTGTVTISGGNIGDSSTSYAVNARCGTAYITGGTITATSGVAVNAAYSDTNVYIGTEESESGPTLTGSYAVQLYSEATVYIYSGTITGSTCGVYMNKGTLYVTGGSISGTAYGIASNGTNNTDYYPNYITISGGTISGAWGMYLPAVGSTTTITGGTITGTSTGIEIRAGSLTVSGGTIKSTSDEFAYTSNGSGTTVIGAGIAISQHSTNQEVTVTITGGTITSNYYGIFEVNTYSTSTSDVTLIVSEGEDGSLPSISGDTAAVYSVSLSGNVDGLTEGVTTYSSEATTVSISAGTFSDQIPLDYCAENYQPTTAQTADDGSTYYTVETKSAVAMISHDDADDVYYDTLSTAVEAASSETEETITIIGAAAVTGSMTVSKNVTIDVADGSITIGTEGSTTSDVTLTITEGATVTITASGDGYVANYGTITVNGTLDISALGYTTDADEAGGLLGGTSGKMSIGANGVFVAPTVWNELWSWNPNMTSATSGSGIFSSAAIGAVVQCGESEWECTTEFVSTSYDSNVTYWSEAMETGVVAKNIDLDSGVIALNFYIYVADGDEVTSVQVDEKTYTDLGSYYDSKTGYYVFSQTVAPTKMTVDCKVIITLSDGSTVEYSATVRDYVREAFDSATDEEKAIMAAMLNYGAMCQVYYGTNSTDLANANLSDAYKKSSYSIYDYASVLSDASSSKEGSGATLSKLSMTQGSTNTLTLTYSSLVVTDLSDCTISVTYGEDEWTEYSISGMKLTITDIGADMLGTNFTVTVKYGTYTSTASVSGYYYIYSLLTSGSYNSQTNLVNMLCSMVAYCESYKA